jgi:hypothetical protein
MIISIWKNLNFTSRGKARVMAVSRHIVDPILTALPTQNEPDSPNVSPIENQHQAQSSPPITNQGHNPELQTMNNQKRSPPHRKLTPGSKHSSHCEPTTESERFIHR